MCWGKWYRFSTTGFWRNGGFWLNDNNYICGFRATRVLVDWWNTALLGIKLGERGVQCS